MTIQEVYDELRPYKGQFESIKDNGTQDPHGYIRHKNDGTIVPHINLCPLGFLCKIKGKDIPSNSVVASAEFLGLNLVEAQEFADKVDCWRKEGRKEVEELLL